MNAANLSVGVTADTTELEKGLKSVNEKLEGMGKKVQGTVGNMLSFAGGIGIVNAVSGSFNFLKDQLGSVFSIAQDSQNVQAQLTAVLKSTGGAAQWTAQQANDLSTALMNQSTFDDEAITGAQSLLLTFTKIGGDIMPQATKTVLDMSQALGQDLKSSSIQLGKALNDPLTGMTALQRVGVTFSDDQKKVIKGFVDSNQLAKAQGVILGELKTEFGGAAEAAGGTFAGKLTILNNQIDNVKETIGTALLPILSKLFDGISPLVKQFGDALPGAMDKVVSFIRINISPVLDALGKLLGDVILPKTKELGEKILPVLKTAFSTVSDIIKNIPGFLNDIGKKFDEALGSSKKQIIDDAKTALSAVGTALSDIWTFAKTNFVPVCEDIVTAIGKVIKKTDDFIGILKTNKYNLTDILTGVFSILSVIGTYMAGKFIVQLAIVNVALLVTSARFVATGVAATIMWAAINWPITLAVAALGLLVFAGIKVWENWDTVKAKAIELALNIGQFIINPLKSIGNWVEWVVDRFNDLKTTISNIGNLDFSGIPGVKGVQDWVGGAWNHLTGHAGGGEVTGSGFYNVGEMGRERVWLNKGAYVQNNTSINNSGGGGGGSQTIILQLDGRDMARMLLPRQMDEIRLRTRMAL